MWTGQRYQDWAFLWKQRREGKASQRESNHWKAEAATAQTKTNHWKNEHSVVSEELSKCRKSRGQWTRKAEAKEIQCQEVLEERTSYFGQEVTLTN